MDNRQSVMDIAEETGISPSTVFKILKQDLQLKCKSAKFVPRVLTDTQKDMRVRMCQTNLEVLKDNPELLNMIVTTDETWISTYEPERKMTSCQWLDKNAPRLQKALRSREAPKTMMTVFWDKRGVIYCEFLPKGETIDSDGYVETLTRMKDHLRRKRPDKWRKRQDSSGLRNFILQQDNASPHTAMVSLAWLGEWGVELLAYPPYSPNLAPCDFHFFPKLKDQICGEHFQNIEELQTAVRRQMRTCPVELFEEGIEDLPMRWRKCITAQGDYFEGKHIRLPPTPDDNAQETDRNSSSNLSSDFEP